MESTIVLFASNEIFLIQNKTMVICKINIKIHKKGTCGADRVGGEKKLPVFRIRKHFGFSIVNRSGQLLKNNNEKE